MRLRIFATTLMLSGLLALAALSPRHPSTAAAAPPPTPPSPSPHAYLNMPPTADGPIPKHLSQVGAFSDLKTLSPTPGLLEYDLNVPFWSDGAQKRRWISLPNHQAIAFSPQGEWRFPPGTVFIKHFETPPTASSPPHRLETRVLVRDATNNVYGVTYRWRPDNSDADLVTQPTTIPAPTLPANNWYLPSPHDCQTCHTPASGGVLGVTTRQLNRPLGPTGTNQLLTWQSRNMFSPDTPLAPPDQLPRLSPPDDPHTPIADRARSWLDANCSHCHRPGGVAGNFDARFDTPLPDQNLIDGPVLINLGIDHAKVLAPADPWRSIALARVETSEGTRMPPLGHLTIDHQGASLLRQWIATLPARPVLSPPTISPKGGDYHTQALVTLTHPDPTATIHYTLDGSLPLKSSPTYSHPLRLTDPTTLRARAYKDGTTQSIAAQETFMVTP